MAYKNGVIYDLTKNVKDIEINTGFIMGLNDVLLYWMTNVLPDVTQVPAILEKFKKIISATDVSKALECELQDILKIESDNQKKQY